MNKKTTFGLDVLIDNKHEQNKIVGNIGYLCHSATVTKDLELGIFPLKKLFGERLKKIFGPQHGFVTDVQDNMVESKHYIHPYFQLPIYSLYSETRIPTDEMLEGINTMIVDLQDVGTRVYTYISTLTLLMKKCAEKKIKVVVLDRPNPVGGERIEGNVLQAGFESFVGMLDIPQRHSLTMAEVGLYVKKFVAPDCEYDFILMTNWNRKMYWRETGLDWVNPSPNLPTPEGTITFAGTVLFEGTNISEGRGTTRSLEVVGHPKIESFSFVDKINPLLKKYNLDGCLLRPMVFQPTFQKHAGISCGGLHIHVTNKEKFNSWLVSQLLCWNFYHELKGDFKWNDKPYEYEHSRLSIDLINGTDTIRKIIENGQDFSHIIETESLGLKEFLTKREQVLLYK